MPRSLLSCLSAPAAALLMAFMLCAAQAQTVTVAPPVEPVDKPLQTAASPPEPVQEALVKPASPSPAEQFSQALNNRDISKATTLLQADPTLAKTLLPDGTPPLVMTLRNYYGYDNGSKQFVQLLLDNGADVNKPDLTGTTPLQAALSRGSDAEGVALLLLNKGADAKAFNTDGKNALHLAVESGGVNLVKILLSHGVDVNVRTQAGDTPLHLAISRQNQDMIDALIAAGANVNLRNNRGDMPIHLAMRLTALQADSGVPARFSVFGRGQRQDKMRGNPLLVPQLLDRGAQINARDQSGMTPLLFALLNRDKINQAVLIQHHAAQDTLTAVFNAAATDDAVTLARLIKTLPDFKDLRAPNGANALHIAALWNAPETTRLLLHSGLETTGRDAAAESPLHYACWFPENAPLAGLLLDAGANVNAEDAFDETPLDIAIHVHSVELTRLLLARKASPDQSNAAGMTPLAIAVNGGSTDIAVMLLNAGADPNARSRYNSGLLGQAIQSRNVALVTLLISKGADVNRVTENSNNSPLMQAVQSGDKDMVTLLLDKGANINYKDRWGQTVLSMARNGYGNNGIADLLKQRGAK